MLDYAPPPDISNAIAYDKQRNPPLVEIVSNMSNPLGELEKKIGGSVYLAQNDNVLSDAAMRVRYEARPQDILITDYHKMGQIVEDPSMPSGLRMNKYKKRSYDNEPAFEIKTNTNRKPSRFEKSKFNDLFMGEKYGSFIRGVFEKYGYDPNKIENLIKKYKNNSIAFYFDGYMVLLDTNQHVCYTLEVSKELIKELI
jgi:hypothetical protein